MSVPERRLSPRIEAQGHGTLENLGDRRCRIINLSRTGALGRSAEVLEEMQLVHMRVQLDHPTFGMVDFRCEAACVRCTRRPDGEYDLGLFFISVPEPDRTALNRVLEDGGLVPIS